MKIGTFAKMNHVTAKMLRYYDRIGLLQPSSVDEQTGYRSYDASQSAVLNWILILKNLNFSLLQIRRMLDGPVDSAEMIRQLVQKRIEFIAIQNDHIQKKIQIDQLIHTLEKEGFHMKKEIDLLEIDAESVHEIKKSMPNMDMFLEQIRDLASSFRDEDDIAVMRFDIAHFKQVNDAYGFDVGDRVIVACYQLISRHVETMLAFPVVGRAGGDEFIIFARADADQARSAARAIVAALSANDFTSSGCPLAVGGYIGGLCSREKSLSAIRKMIETSIGFLQKAREAGVNSVYIQ
ncbi:MAG: diguanylate cyclase [Clostridiaceae bacterium]|nr:diguanylate cyclase [Clostridiales bacterium]MDD2441615.1 diguanylate cyclase [Eubacteriales bacterium]MDD4138863.1 diguanylate cyclase [Eubacteriales bacterium]MDD4744897.1 diguanylate cyclase [Eubacteriales bacterium]NLB43871.1 diguanylate cyclase [Clostridiaceae bacterium]